MDEQQHAPDAGGHDEASVRKAHRIAVMGRDMPLPASRGLRIATGAALVLGGTVGFLPIVGFWMIPLGLLVLSVDLGPVRRWRRRTAVRWGRWRATRRN